EDARSVAKFRRESVAEQLDRITQAFASDPKIVNAERFLILEGIREQERLGEANRQDAQGRFVGPLFQGKRDRPGFHVCFSTGDRLSVGQVLSDRFACLSARRSRRSSVAIKPSISARSA